MKDVKKNVCVCVNSAYAYSPPYPAVTVLVPPYISAIPMAADVPLAPDPAALGDAFLLEGSVQLKGASSPGLCGDLLGWRLMTKVGRGSGLTGDKAPASEATLGAGETDSGIRQVPCMWGHGLDHSTACSEISELS